MHFHFQHRGKGVARPPTGCFTHHHTTFTLTLFPFHFLALSLLTLGKRCRPSTNRLFCSYNMIFTFTHFHFYFQPWGIGIVSPLTGCFIHMISLSFTYTVFNFTFFHFHRIQTGCFARNIYLSLSPTFTLFYFHFQYWGRGVARPPTAFFDHIIKLSLSLTFNIFQPLGKGLVSPPIGELCFPHNY